jgi:hypothetical protein
MIPARLVEGQWLAECVRARPLSFWSSRQALFDTSIKRRILSDAESIGWIDPADLPMFIKGLSRTP